MLQFSLFPWDIKTQKSSRLASSFPSPVAIAETTRAFILDTLTVKQEEACSKPKANGLSSRKLFLHVGPLAVERLVLRVDLRNVLVAVLNKA